MKTNDEIRRENLLVAIKRMRYASSLAEKVGTSAAYLSQIKNQTPDSKTGKPKAMGDDLARKIEVALKEPEGWMDTEHTYEFDDPSKKSQISGIITASLPEVGRNVDLMTRPVGTSHNFRRVYVVGKAQGGLPERIWTDGDHLVGAIDEYAEIATPDPQAFICPVVGDSMYPRFMPGEYVLVEPSTVPQLGGTVLVRLKTGETMLKRLDHRANDHVRLGSWNDPVQHTFREEDISWMYYVAHAVPPEKIKMRF